jgi:hypothetical protein
MSEKKEFICGDCKGITEIATKRGSRVLEILLWTTLIFPGFLYTIWRNSGQKKICRYCDSDFLLPADSPHTFELIKK